MEFVIDNQITSLEHDVIDSLRGRIDCDCGPSVVPCFNEMIDSFKKEDYENARLTSQDMYDFAWDKLHTGKWSEVKNGWRILFATSCFISVTSEIRTTTQSKELSYWTNLIRKCDMALIMGCEEPLESIIHNLVEKIHSMVYETFEPDENIQYTPSPSHKKRKINTDSSTIPRVKNISPTTFYKEYVANQHPVIITGSFEGLQQLDDIMHCMAYRTVPVEVGKDYTDPDWSQKMMLAHEYIRNYVLTTNSPDKRGYLAQHSLFDQIRPLSQYIEEPTVGCMLGEGELVTRNAWLGPSGTVSPLHTDPYDNLFLQLMGDKFVRLYNKDQTNKLYAQQEGLLTNTSYIRDIHQVCDINYPLFKEAEYMECVLTQGEMLYIPKLFWHYVESLSVSFSVSYWYK
ncbi:lysine-specific demethylase [Acrasis kona]|uniref:Lysine-specific demethylase n=1 Tax=Acrasis kona TaxID=1008807 RepID=A0AAW2Z4K2_9EUKA